MPKASSCSGAAGWLGSRRMADTADVVTVERTIKADPQAIFDLLADPNRHRDIDGSGTVREAKDSSAPRLSMGAKFGMSMKLGAPYSMLNEVIEYDEPKRIAWQTRPPSSWGARLFGGRIWRYELDDRRRHARARELGRLAGEATGAFSAEDRSLARPHPQGHGFDAREDRAARHATGVTAPCPTCVRG